MGSILEVPFWNWVKNKTSAGKAVERYYKYCIKRRGKAIAGFANIMVFTDWPEKLYYCITDGCTLVAVEVFPEDLTQIDFGYRYDLVGTRDGKLIVERSELHAPNFASVAMTGIKEPISDYSISKTSRYSLQLSAIIVCYATKHEERFGLDYGLLDGVASCLHGLNGRRTLYVYFRNDTSKPVIISAGDSAFGLVMPFKV